MLLSAGEVLAEGKISGYMFGDYYYFIGNHHEDLEDTNGFWFRRIYFTYDHKWDDTDFSTRLRFEMTNNGKYSNGEIAGDKMDDPAVKDAYLKYKFSDQALYVGISSTPTWGAVEKLWGYRCVEKTPLDLYKLGSSRDFGLALKGKFGPVKYHYMFGNGNSNKSESNEGKKVYFSFGYDVIKGLLVEAYGDVEWRDDDEDRYTYQLFASYKTDAYRFGLQFAGQTRSAGKAGGDAETLSLASAYGVYKISKYLSVFARGDRMFDPNPSGEGISYIPIDKTSEFFFFVFGLDFTPISSVHFIPNFEFITYDENDAGQTPDNDVIGRITFYYKF